MRFLLLLVAAVVAIFAGVAALQLSNNSAPAGPAPAAQTAAANANVLTVDVLVARQPIPAGTQLTPAMVDKQPWPENLVLEGFIVSTGPNADITGKVTRSALQAREPLIASKLANSGESGFLASTLPQGMRAITISTDAITGVAGYVFPGDRIDLIFTHNIPEKGKSASAASGPALSIPGLGAIGGTPASPDGAGYAEILASNIPVLAINIRSGDVASTGASFIPSAESIASSVAGGSTNTPSSMTLQVSDQQAAKIRLAERVGTLSVSLRSLKDRVDTPPPPPTDLSSLTQVSLSPAVQQQIQNEEVKVYRGGMNAAPAAPSGLNLYTPGAR